MRTNLCLFVGMTLVACCTLNAREPKAEKKEDVVLKIYDVRDLTTSVRNFELPRYGKGSEIPHPGIKKKNPFDQINASTIAEMIQNRIKPESWDANLGTSVEERFGMLIVMQRPEVHRLIFVLLRNFRSQVRVQILVRGRFVVAERVPEVERYPKKQFEEMLEKIGVGAVLSRPQILCQNMQRVHLRCGREHNYIYDVDISGSVQDPVVRNLLEGLIFEARPVLLADQKTVELDIKIRLSENMTFPKAPKAKPGVGKALKVNPRLATVEANSPSMDRHHFTTQVRVPEGHWVLAAVGQRKKAKSGFENILFFVNAEVSTLK